MHPGWMHKVQNQIDDVVGPDRLPSFADRPRLPYIEAAVRGKYIYSNIIISYLLATEIVRWRPAIRFGVPHESTADDVVEYNGEQYFIPAGASVFAVIW